MPDDQTATDSTELDAGTGQDSNDVSSLPEWAQKLITDNRKEAAKYRTQARDLKPLADEAQRLRATQQTDAEKTAEQLKAAEKRAQDAVTRIAQAEIRALAAPEFANAEDASRFLDASHYVGTDGDFDSATAASDLKALLTERPYLAKATAGGSRAPAYQPGQGSSGNTGQSDPKTAFDAWFKSRTA